MNARNQKDRRLQAAKEAAEWLLALQSLQESSAEHAEFVDWLRESPLHVAELLHVCRLQHALSAFSKWKDIDEVRDFQEDRVVGHLPTAWRSRRSVAFRRSLLRWRTLGAAACLVVAAVLSAIVAVRLGQKTISTQPGERREVTLADGSAVDLVPDSEIRVRLLAKERLVTLDRGEALFYVAKNPKRPFIVTAGDSSVRAVGTAFDVQRRATGIVVTVVEGRVTVTPRGRLASGPSVTRPRGGASLTATSLSLGANEQITIFARTGDATAVRKVHGAEEVALATGALDFDNEPVGQVANRFNLYNHMQIRILDAALAGRRVSGSFRATDPESFVAFLESVAGVTVVQQDSNTITLGSQPSATQAAMPSQK